MAKFKFVVPATFTAPVKVILPNGDQQEFTATFKYLADNEVEELLKKLVPEVLRSVWVGWGNDLVGDDDQPLPFSDETRDGLLDHSFVTSPVLDAFIAGRRGLRAKN